MRMLGTGIDMQVAVQVGTQSVLGQHAADGVLKDALGMAAQQLGGSGLTLAAGVAGIALINLVGHLFASENDLLGIDDDNVVAAINVRCEVRLGLAS